MLKLQTLNSSNRKGLFFLTEHFIYHNLEYGDTKSGQLEDWLVKKIFLYACNQKSLKRNLF